MRRRLFILTLASLLMPSPHFANESMSTPAAREEVKKAEAARDAGDFKAAREAYHRACVYRSQSLVVIAVNVMPAQDDFVLSVLKGNKLDFIAVRDDEKVSKAYDAEDVAPVNFTAGRLPYSTRTTPTTIESSKTFTSSTRCTPSRST